LKFGKDIKKLEIWCGISRNSINDTSFIQSNAFLVLPTFKSNRIRRYVEMEWCIIEYIENFLL